MNASHILPSDNSTVLNNDSINAGFTQSEITTWDDCAEKWYLGYNHMLRRRGSFAWYFAFGSAVHKALEDYYTRGTMSESFTSLQLPDDAILDATQESDRDYWEALLPIQMEQYARHWKDGHDASIEVEAIIHVQFQGVHLSCKIDRLIRSGGGLVLWDHKTASRFDQTALTGWDFRFQFMFYMWMVQQYRGGEPVKEFVVNGIKKPALRLKKDESQASFLARIKADMIQQPDEYFKRIPLASIAGSMKHFEERVLKPKLERIALLTQPTTPASIVEVLARNQNTNSCVKFGSVCQFLPICQNGFKLEGFQYVQRDSKHEELEATE
jgi:hypothetical protein